MTPDTVAAFIRENSIQGEIIRLTQHAATVQAAAEALGVAPDKVLKSVLVLANSNPVLVITNGLARIDVKRLANYLDISRKKINLADPATTLELTGFGIGAVPPFGHPTKLRTLIDSDVLEHKDVFAGGGAPDVVLRLAPSEIVRVTDAESLNLASREAESSQAPARA